MVLSFLHIDCAAEFERDTLGGSQSRVFQDIYDVTHQKSRIVVPFDCKPRFGLSRKYRNSKKFQTCPLEHLASHTTPYGYV